VEELNGEKEGKEQKSIPITGIVHIETERKRMKDLEEKTIGKSEEKTTEKMKKKCERKRTVTSFVCFRKFSDGFLSLLSQFQDLYKQ